MAASRPTLPEWYRVLAIVVGVVSIGLALVVLVEPALGLFLLVFLLGFALLVIGIDRLVTGITGHPYSWPMPPSMGASPGSGVSPTESKSPEQH